jgi:hypothetical protein
MLLCEQFVLEIEIALAKIRSATVNNALLPTLQKQHPPLDISKCLRDFGVTPWFMNCNMLFVIWGPRGSLVVKALGYKPEGR